MTTRHLILATAVATALVSHGAGPLAQELEQARTVAQRPVIDSFTLRTVGDTADYPQLPEGTDLLQWYRERLHEGVPAAAWQVEEMPLIATAPFAVVEGGVGLNPGGPQYAWDGPHFDVAEFEAQIRQKMDNKAIGYSYAINFQKQLYTADGVGFERIDGDGDGPYWHDGYGRMNIASISKTLTAVAVLQLLEKNGLSIYDPVGPWLPDDWDKAYGFDNPQFIRFYDLLTHHSGLKQTIQAIEAFDAEFKSLDKVKWDGLKAVVARGTIPAYYEDPNPAYSNVNFALFRVIIPALWKASGENPGIGELDELEAAALYASYMAENLFIPLGIHQAACYSLEISLRYYNFHGPSNEAGAPAGNWHLSCGSGGWYLSAYNLANLMANIRYNDNILSPAMRSLMDEHKLGWSYSWSQNGDHGHYLAHAGALYLDPGDFGERREMQGCVMKFPIHVEAVLLVNSSIKNNILPCTKLAAAFDNAWVD
jgi:D-alanyl-D-alanine carboxypeptidase